MMYKFENVDQLASQLADRVGLWVREAVESRGVAHVVLAGGSTPAALHRKLVDRDLPWSDIHIYFGDERCVPPDHADSNFAAAHASLLALVELPDSNIHRMRAEQGQAEVARYAAELPERFDVVLLGMGEDGHTASLFPGSTLLESSDPVVYVGNSPKPPPERISLGLASLNRARRVAFMVAGEGKANALALIKAGELLPAARVKPLDGEIGFYVDHAAARDLSNAD